MDLKVSSHAINFIKEYAKEHEWDNVIPAKNLFALMHELALNNFFSPTPKSYWEEEYEWNRRKSQTYLEFEQKANGTDRTLMFGDSSVIRAMNEVMNEIALITGFSEFDFSEFKVNDMYDCGIAAFLKADFDTDITVNGTIVMRYALSNDERRRAKHLIIKGKFILQPASDRDINIPNKLRVPPFDCVLSHGTIHYESVKEYQQRDSRMNRLQENKLKREAMKKAKEKGMLSLPDFYGVPLDIGCTVAFSWGQTCRQGIVEGQTAARIIVREFGSEWTCNCRPCEVLRI